MIDTHTHVLFGIDDGAKTLEDSVELVRELSLQGITDVVATPHYIDESSYVSKVADNKKILTILKRKLKSEKIDVNVVLGNEIYINSGILKLIKDKKISTVGTSKYLLIELPMSGEYPNYEDIFVEILHAGYKVILAHPERYDAMQKDFQLLKDLYDMGVLFQCNIGSIVGRYGKGAKKTVKKLAKNKMIFEFGSDIHHLRGTKEIPLAQKKFRKYYKEQELEEILVDNPKKTLKK